MTGWEWRVYITCVSMSVWIAVDLTHWTWHGAKQAAAFTPEAERLHHVLLGYRRYRWLALVASTCVLLGAIFAWYVRSTNLLLDVVIAGFCIHFVIGRGSFALRHAWSRIRR